MIADLRVVVLSYGPGRQYEALLETLGREGVPPERILLVHNPSRPDEEAPEPGGIEVIRADRNLGYAAGMNLGIGAQLDRGCELLLLLTHDARLREPALRRLLEAGATDPGYGVLGPALLLSGTETPFSFGGYATRSGGLGHRREPNGPLGAVSACDWVDGGTMLIRAEALHRVGGFDERFWSYVEDADLCGRIARAGFGVGVVVAAAADQEPGMKKRLGPWAYLMSRNGIAYARRFAGRGGALVGTARAAAAAAFALLRTAARLVRLRPGPPVETWAVAAGTARGVAAFYRGRWGPPPADLPGGSDIGNLEPARRDPDGT